MDENVEINENELNEVAGGGLLDGVFDAIYDGVSDLLGIDDNSNNKTPEQQKLLDDIKGKTS